MNLRGRISIKYRDTNYDWVDATNGVLQIDIYRGIPQYYGCWSQVEPGQLRIRTRNTNLDPYKNPEIGLFSIIRVEADGVPIFTGKIFDTNTEYVPREDSIVTIDAFDELGVLSQIKYGNRGVIGHDYQNNNVLVSPTNFGTLLQSGTFLGNPNWAKLPQSGHINGEALIPNYNQCSYTSDYNIYSGVNKHVWTTSDQNKFPTPTGSSTYLVPAPNPAPGYSTESTWTLPDWDGVVITNPGTIASFGNIRQDGTTSATTTGLSYLHYQNIWYNNDSTKVGSRPGINDTGHPLYGSYGFWKTYYSTIAANYAVGDWAALFTTNDDNALTLWKKSEQAEAGFGYVDAYNRFRHLSRTIVDNDTWHEKARFATDGTGISYNNIKVTNGWESVVKGITINNLWSSNVKSIHDIVALYDDNTATYYTKAASLNRDGTSGVKLLNPASTGNPPKNFDWLAYSATETKYPWYKFAKTNGGNFIFDVNCKDLNINNLSTLPYFKGTTTVNGNNQLSIDTNYAWEMNTDSGGFTYKRDNTKIDYNFGTTGAFRDGISVNVNARAEELADEILTNYANPITDIRSINFDVTDNSISTIKSVDIFDRINIDHDESGLTIDKNYAVMGITHSITPDNWNITYQLWNQSGRP